MILKEIEYFQTLLRYKQNPILNGAMLCPSQKSAHICNIPVKSMELKSVKEECLVNAWHFISNFMKANHLLLNYATMLSLLGVHAHMCTHAHTPGQVIYFTNFSICSSAAILSCNYQYKSWLGHQLFWCNFMFFLQWNERTSQCIPVKWKLAACNNEVVVYCTTVEATVWSFPYNHCWVSYQFLLTQNSITEYCKTAMWIYCIL